MCGFIKRIKLRKKDWLSRLSSTKYLSGQRMPMEARNAASPALWTIGVPMGLTAFVTGSYDMKSSVLKNPSRCTSIHSSIHSQDMTQKESLLPFMSLPHIQPSEKDSQAEL